jgi:hypothetical protein
MHISQPLALQQPARGIKLSLWGAHFKWQVYCLCCCICVCTAHVLGCVYIMWEAFAEMHPNSLYFSQSVHLHIPHHVFNDSRKCYCSLWEKCGELGPTSVMFASHRCMAPIKAMHVWHRRLQRGGRLIIIPGTEQLEWHQTHALVTTTSKFPPMKVPPTSCAVW